MGCAVDRSERVPEEVDYGRRDRTGPPAAFAQVAAAIDVWASHWNDDPKPFVWTKTVDDIITKVKPGRAALNEARRTTR